MYYPDPRHSQDNFDSWLDKCPFDWERIEQKKDDNQYDTVSIRFYVLAEEAE